MNTPLSSPFMSWLSKAGLLYLRPMQKLCVRSMTCWLVRLMSMALLLGNSASKAEESGRAAVLKKALMGADRIEMKEVRFDDGEEAVKPFVFRDGSKIAELIACLDFDDASSGFYCMCAGDSVVTFFNGDAEIASLSHHHGHSLRWKSKSWKGDSLFTSAAAEAWRTWFKDQGEMRFENMFLAAQKEAREEAEIEAGFMAPFPAAAAAIFKKARNADNEGMLSYAPRDEGRPPEASPAAKELAGLFKTPVELGLALCRALGSLCVRGANLGSWTASTYREQLVLTSAKLIQGDNFEKVLERANDQELLGAARLFFFEKFSQQIPETSRGPWAAKLARVVIEKDASGNSSEAIRALTRHPSPEASSLLAKVAEGSIQATGPSGYEELSCRAAACVVLAQIGGGDVLKLAETIAKEPNLSPLDDAALKVARAWVSGGIVDAETLAFESYTVALAALAVLEKRGDAQAIDVIIAAGLDHAYGVPREESVLTLQRMTGQMWLKDPKNERAERHTEAIQKWWKQNRDTFKKREAK